MNLWICTKCGEYARGTFAEVFEPASEHMCELNTPKSDNFGECINILKELSPLTKTQIPTPPALPQFGLTMPNNKQQAMQAPRLPPPIVPKLPPPIVPAPISIGAMSFSDQIRNAKLKTTSKTSDENADPNLAKVKKDRIKRRLTETNPSSTGMLQCFDNVNDELQLKLQNISKKRKMLGKMIEK